MPLSSKTILIGLSSLLAIPLTLLIKHYISKRPLPKATLLDFIGNTPLIYLPRLSQAIGCPVYCKAQFMNPFGSSKDRAVKKMIQGKEAGQVVQASSGSTAISLVQISHIKGLKTVLYMPNDLAQDKYTLLDLLSATLIKVPPVSIVDSNHFYNLARTHAEQNKSIFLDQFQNELNCQAHYQSTGPQIYKQTNGMVDAFVCAAGTGGTIAGVGKYLKQKNNHIEVVLADPQGSGLFNKVVHGVLYTSQEKEGHRLKNPFDTVVEGIGLNRPTHNFSLANIDTAFKVLDVQALHMSHYLIENEGLFVGGSTAVNLCGVVKLAKKWRNIGKSGVIVTIAHDGGGRYLRKWYSQPYLQNKGLEFKRKQQYPPNDLSFIRD